MRERLIVDHFALLPQTFHDVSVLLLHVQIVTTEPIEMLSHIGAERRHLCVFQRIPLSL